MKNSSMGNRLISSDNSERLHTQSPMNNYDVSSNKLNFDLPSSREVSVASKTSSIISTVGTDRRTSLSEFDRELRAFDIDLSKNDISETENDPYVLTRSSKKISVEGEVKQKNK